MNFNIVKKECKKPLFWQAEEFNNFVISGKYNKVTFDKFLNVMDEYYTITYSSLLSRNAWLVFGWLRLISNKDGFIYASYESIIDVFCKNGTKVSKPTFFKCIAELEKNDLIVSINTKNNSLNGCKIYGIVDKTYVVYQLCDIIECNLGVTTYEAVSALDSKKQKKLFDVEANIPTPKDKESKKPKLPDNKRYSLLMKTIFKPINKEVDEFFVFVGSYNKSGKIALSRKLKILLGLKEYLDCEFELSDFVYAFNLTMKNTRRGKNPYRERYTFKILENMCEYEDDEEDTNDVADELSKKAESKIIESYNNNGSKKTATVTGRVVLTKTSYEVEKKKIMTNEGYYKAIVKYYDLNTPSNKFEEQAYKIALAVKKKFDEYERNTPHFMARLECLRKVDYYESIGYDDKWNRILYWEDSDGNSLDKNTVQKLLKKNGVDFVISKYDIIGG